MPGEHVEAGRDAYVSGGDIRIHRPAQSGAAPIAPRPPRRIWGSVPARNPGFTGREELLIAVRDVLAVGDRALVQVLHGMGGVGKTQLAIEYAHRFADDYDVVWWVNAENTAPFGEQFAALAVPADVTVLPRAEPVALLRGWAPALTQPKPGL